MIKAESIYDIFLALDQTEKETFCKLIKNPIPQTETNWIHTWDALSEYLGDISVRSLQRYEKEGIITKYRLGKKVFFKKSEIDKSLIRM